MKAFLALAAVLVAPTAALHGGPTMGRVSRSTMSMGKPSIPASLVGKTTVVPSFEPRGLEDARPVRSALAAALVLAAPSAALAKDGAYGFLEGKGPALVHPAVMAVTFLVGLNAAYTGIQWRRLRGITAEVNSLKAQLKPLKEKAEGPEEVPAALSSQIRELEGQISSLSETRSSLSSANLRDTHWSMGSILLGIGTSFAIEGPVNTYMRAGKLFPGPHLYAGAGCVVLWALAAALVPQMQKGNEGARLAHIGFNVAGMGLFAWQLPTGWQILSKVWAKVPW